MKPLCSECAKFDADFKCHVCNKLLCVQHAYDNRPLLWNNKGEISYGDITPEKYCGFHLNLLKSAENSGVSRNNWGSMLCTQILGIIFTLMGGRIVWNIDSCIMVNKLLSMFSRTSARGSR